MFDTAWLFLELDQVRHLFGGRISDMVVEAYHGYLSSRLTQEQVRDAIKQALIQGKMYPSAEWLASAVVNGHAENEAAYKVFSASSGLALPAAEGEPEVDADKAFAQRVAFMAGIFKHQGDSRFYRKMLSNNADVYSRIAQRVCGSARVTHEDVLVYCGLMQAEPEQEPEFAGVGADDHEFF